MAEIDALASTSGLPNQTFNDEKVVSNSLTNHQQPMLVSNDSKDELTETQSESLPGTSKTSEESQSGSSRTEGVGKKKISGASKEKPKLMKKPIIKETTEAEDNTEIEAGSSKENIEDKVKAEKKRIAKDISEAGPSRERTNDKLKEEAGSSKEDKSRKRTAKETSENKKSEERELTIEEKIKEEKVRIANEILKEKIRKGKEEIEKRENLKKELENKSRKESKNAKKRDKSKQTVNNSNSNLKLEEGESSKLISNDVESSKENHEEGESNNIIKSESSKQKSQENETSKDKEKQIRIAKAKKKKVKLQNNEKETDKISESKNNLELDESSKTNQEDVLDKTKQKLKRRVALRKKEKERKKEESAKNDKIKKLEKAMKETALIVEEGESSLVFSEISDTKSIKEVTEEARIKKRKKVLIKKKSKCKQVKIYRKPDWQKHISYLKGNQKNSDFQFIVGDEKKIFYGHKFIFACRSSEFDGLFYSDKPFEGQIVIPGVKSKDFYEFYNYIYTGKIIFTGNSIEGILKSSEICNFTEITEKCDSFLSKECLDSECEFNVLEILKLTNRFKLPLAEAKCLDIFASKYQELFESPDFLICSKETLTKIVNYPLHSCKEIDLYFAVDKWLEKYCEEQKKEPTAENKKKIIGNLLNKIRFKSMSVDDFTKVKESTNCVLSLEEIEEISKEITTGTNNHQRLCQKNLSKVEMFSCLRFPNGPQNTINFRSVRESELSFTTNKFILCYGLGIYGFKVKSPEESIKRTFLIRLMDQDDDVIAEGRDEIIFNGSKQIYEILFKKHTVLQPDCKYKIWIKLIEKQPSYQLSIYCGVDGARKITTTGCKFRFKKSSNTKFKHDTRKIGILASVLFKI